MAASSVSFISIAMESLKSVSVVYRLSADISIYRSERISPRFLVPRMFLSVAAARDLVEVL